MAGSQTNEGTATLLIIVRSDYMRFMIVVIKIIKIINSSGTEALFSNIGKEKPARYNRGASRSKSRVATKVTLFLSVGKAVAILVV